MPRFAANLSLMFTEVDFLDRFKAAADAGFKGVEFLFPYEWSQKEIASRLDDFGLELVLFNLFPGDWDAGERGLTALTGREHEFDAALAQALEYASGLKCPRVHAMAGRNSDGAARETFIDNLTKACAKAGPMSIDILIEPINTHDIPDYFLTRTADAAAIIHEVGAANLGLQFDLYHRHMMEGDVAQALDDYAHLARHFQVAGPPDRGEPHPSDMDCAPLFEKIDATGFNGWIGCEYRPRAGTHAGLNWLGACGMTPGGDPEL